MATRIPKKKLGNAKVFSPGTEMHMKQKGKRNPEQKGVFASGGDSPAKAAEAQWGYQRIAPTGLKPADGGVRSTAKRKAPKAPKAEPLEVTSVKPAKKRAGRAEPATWDFDDGDSAAAARESPKKAASATLLAADDSDDDSLLDDAAPLRSAAPKVDLLAAAADNDDDDDVLGAPGGAARKKPAKKKTAELKNPYNFDGGDDEASSAPEPAAHSELLAADDSDDDDLFGDGAPSSPRGAAASAAAGARASPAASPRRKAPRTPRSAAKATARGAEASATKRSSSATKKSSPRRKAAAERPSTASAEKKRKSPARAKKPAKKPRAPSSSDSGPDDDGGGDEAAALEGFFEGGASATKATKAKAKPAAATAGGDGDDEASAVAPAALAKVDEYELTSDRLIWVRVGELYYFDGRKTYPQRPGYVLTPEELEARQIPRPVGGDNMRVVSLFDDGAFCPWDEPRAVRKSETCDFGGGRSSASWSKRMVESLQKCLSPREFRHVFDLGAKPALAKALANDKRRGVTNKVARRDRVSKSPERSPHAKPKHELAEYDEHDAAYDAVRDYLLSSVLAARDDVARKDLEPLVDLLAEPNLFSYRVARDIVKDPTTLPLHALDVALGDAPDDLDADKVATCADTLARVVDGSLVASLRALERHPA